MAKGTVGKQKWISFHLYNLSPRERENEDFNSPGTSQPGSVRAPCLFHASPKQGIRSTNSYLKLEHLLCLTQAIVRREGFSLVFHNNTRNGKGLFILALPVFLCETQQF